MKLEAVEFQKLLEDCAGAFCEQIRTAPDGTALDLDSFKLANVLFSVSQILGVDLYDLMDRFDTGDFATRDTFMKRMTEVLPLLRADKARKES